MLKGLIVDYNDGNISAEKLVEKLEELSRLGYIITKPSETISEESNPVWDCDYCEIEITSTEYMANGGLCDDCENILHRFDEYDPYNCSVCGEDPEDCYCNEED